MELSVETMRYVIKNVTFQQEMINWVERVLRPLENDQNYLALCQANSPSITTKVLKKAVSILEPFIILGTPAHDSGHHKRDGLGGAAIIAKDLFLRSGYRNDRDAAFIASMFHDGSTGVQHRYIDLEWLLNHGEIMAYILYHLLEDVISEPVRRLAAYAIAAHPHALKDITVNNGCVRRPWNDILFYDQGHPVRLAVWVARWTDRLENGGDPVHLARHILAATDGALVGGMDLHKIDWYSFEDQLKYLFFPAAINIDVVTGGQPKKIPTLLQHLQGYRLSADTSKWSAYNQNDHLSPSMMRLMGWKSSRSIALIDTIFTTTGEPHFVTLEKLLTMVSGYPLTDATQRSLTLTREIWEATPAEDQSHWAKGFDLAQTGYYEWLAILTDEILSATDSTIQAFAPLCLNHVHEVTRF